MSQTWRAFRLALWCAPVLAGLCAPDAHALESPTLQRIRLTGVINLGHRESSFPFSYKDDNGQVIGYAQALMLRAAQAIKEELKLPELRLNLMQVSAGTRMSMIESGEIDLECGTTTNTLERQRRVAFSNTYFVAATRLMVATDSKIKDYPDLAGKTVLVQATSTQEAALRRINEEKKMGMTILTASAPGEAYLAMETGRAAAYMMDDVRIYGRIAIFPLPSRWKVVGPAFSLEGYGCMMAKDDPELKRIVDTTLARILSSPEGVRLYKKWFQSPTPPKGVNLNLPMSPATKYALEHPNDKSLSD